MAGYRKRNRNVHAHLNEVGALLNAPRRGCRRRYRLILRELWPAEIRSRVRQGIIPLAARAGRRNIATYLRGRQTRQRISLCSDMLVSRKGERQGRGTDVMYSPMPSTAMPNAISVAPNGRANDSTVIPLCKGLFAFVLTETRKSCTRAT
jgi:hypothetical protein